MKGERERVKRGEGERVNRGREGEREEREGGR